MVTPSIRQLTPAQLLRQQELGALRAEQVTQEIRRRQTEDRERRHRQMAEQDRRQELADVQAQRRAILGAPSARQVAEDVLERRRRVQPSAPIERIAPIPVIAPEPPPVRREEVRQLTSEEIAQRVERRQLGAGQAQAELQRRTRDGATPQVRQAAQSALQRVPEVRQAPVSVTEQLRRERIQQATVTELADALRDPEISARRLIEAGAPRERVRQAEQAVIAQRRLQEFSPEPGRFNVAEALRNRVSDSTIRQAGFNPQQIALAKERNRILDRIKSVDLGRITDSKNKVARDVISEVFTLTGRETETFNKRDIEQRYDRARQELVKVYNEKVIELQKEGKGERPITTREEFVLQNLGTKDGYTKTVLENQDNLKALTAKGKEIGRFTKEVGLASIPIYGTVRTWDEDPNWARAASVALDVAFIIPIVGQVGAGVRAGKGFKAIAQRATVSSIRAETLGQIEAIAHPIRTTTATVRPLIDLLDPKKVPSSTLFFRDTTVRLPAEREYYNISKRGHPFAVNIPKGAIEGLGVATVELPGAKKGTRFPSNQAAKEFVTGRDVAAMRQIRGESGEAFLGTTKDGKRIEVKLPAPAFSRNVGAAAFHGTSDIRTFLPGTEIKATGIPGEDGLFVAPTALEGYALRKGHAGALDPTVKKAIDDLPEKTKSALGIAKLSDKPMPGFIVIRDPDLLRTLQGSNKFWRGTTEIEMVLPPGTKLPPPVQIIKSRAPNGEAFFLAIYDKKPLSKAEIARLKIVGLKESLNIIFSKPGTFKIDKRQQRLMQQSAEQAKRAENAFFDANELKVAGKTAESSRKLEEADRLAEQAGLSYRRAQGRAATNLARATLHPQALYTGRQDIERALTESDLGRPPSRQLQDERRARNSVDAAIQRPSRGQPTGDRRPDTSRIDVDGRPPTAPPKKRPPSRPEFARERPVEGRAPEPPPKRRPPGREEFERIRPVGGRPSEPQPGKRPPPPAAPPPDKRPPQPPAPPDGRIPKFDLPGDAEKSLKPGEFPRVVTWRQGVTNITVDIDRGTRTFSKAKGTGKGITPDESFRVVTKDKTQPEAKEFDQGVVKLNVTPRRVFFTRRKLRE